MKPFILCCALVLNALAGAAFTRQDTLRGSNGRGRDWWDVMKYDLSVKIDTATRSISGTNTISFRIIGAPTDSLQIDLQDSMQLDEVRYGDSLLPYSREGNVYWIATPKDWQYSPKELWHFAELKIELSFHGKPRTAVSPPWDGGFIWTKDSTGKPWIAVACQGLGASCWWPCKDYQGDEPDSGMTIWYFRPTLSSKKRGDDDWGVTTDRPSIIDTSFNCVTNGRMQMVLIENPINGDEMKACEAAIHNPINTYNATFYIGDYAHWHDTLHGEKGVLDLDFYPLKYNEAKARRQWRVVKDMLRCYEYWLGPYPFYEDGYKLVEAPYAGMEHQSAIAYGNEYGMGYSGRDRSGTGVGMAFDFIVVHESGHEWFGNSITARDIADNWLHEGFTTYCEALFAQWIRGRDAAFAYTTGEWKNIKADRPVIGAYGVNDEGSDDKYDKGSAVVHMIRLMLNSDTAFRQLMRGLNRDFYHKIVTSKEVEDYISAFTGRDLKPFFDVYLRGTILPTLRWTVKKSHGKRYLDYEWQDAPEGFIAPVLLDDGRIMPLVNPRSVYSGGQKWKIDATPPGRHLKAAGLYHLVRF